MKIKSESIEWYRFEDELPKEGRYIIYRSKYNSTNEFFIRNIDGKLFLVYPNDCPSCVDEIENIDMDDWWAEFPKADIIRSKV